MLTLQCLDRSVDWSLVSSKIRQTPAQKFEGFEHMAYENSKGPLSWEEEVGFKNSLWSVISAHLELLANDHPQFL